MENKTVDLGAQLRALARRLGLEDLKQALYFPRYIELETVNICNAHCLMCPIKTWKPPCDRFMPDELFEKILSEIRQYSDWIRVVSLSRDGEPLLDKNLEEKVKRLKEAGVKTVTFSSNVSLLTGERPQKLLEAGLDDIMFSIDSLDEAVFEKIRKGLSFKQVLANALNFIRTRDAMKSNCTIRVRMVKLKENEGDFLQWRQFWDDKLSSRDRVYLKPLHNWGNQIDVGPVNSGEKELTAPCISPWSTMAIHVDGAVSLCAVDFKREILLGQLTRQSMVEVWQGDHVREIREIHAAGMKDRLKFCRGCEIWREK